MSGVAVVGLDGVNPTLVESARGMGLSPIATFLRVRLPLAWPVIVAGLLILLLAVVIWRALAISAQADDLFGRVAAAGIACWWGFQAFQNIGMCLGIMPVTGVPLPFVSYGGSSLFAGMLALGLLQNIHLRSAGPVRR